MADPPNNERDIPSVLVVDDNKDHVDSLCEWVELTTRWRASRAYSVGEAIALAELGRPDAVFLDLEMRPSSGLQFVDAMASRFADRLPAIFTVSGNADLLEAAAADPRVRGVALKPVNPDVLARWLDGARSCKQ